MTATLNINTLRQRAAAFAKDFSKSTYEMGEAQDFIRGLCHVFELNHRRARAGNKAVDTAYGYKPSKAEGNKKDDAACIAFLFERYQEQLAL